MTYDLVENLFLEAECEIRRHCVCKPKKIAGVSVSADQWNLYRYDQWIATRVRRCGWHEDYDLWLAGKTTRTIYTRICCVGEGCCCLTFQLANEGCDKCLCCKRNEKGIKDETQS